MQCKQEKADLERQRVALLEEVQSYRNKIKQLEDDLLFRLSNSQAWHALQPHILALCDCRCPAE